MQTANTWFYRANNLACLYYVLCALWSSCGEFSAPHKVFIPDEEIYSQLESRVRCYLCGMWGTGGCPNLAMHFWCLQNTKPCKGWHEQTGRRFDETTSRNENLDFNEQWLGGLFHATLKVQLTLWCSCKTKLKQQETSYIIRRLIQVPVENF